MNRHKQVLAIGRKVVGRGCNYSEANKRMRRVKYWRVANVQDKMVILRAVLDAAGLTEVLVKSATLSHYNGVIDNYGINLYVPLAWGNE